MWSFHVAFPSPDTFGRDNKPRPNGPWLKILENEPNALRWRLGKIDPAPLRRTSREQSSVEPAIPAKSFAGKASQT
jgi:hypothetical protein